METREMEKNNQNSRKKQCRIDIRKYFIESTDPTSPLSPPHQLEIQLLQANISAIVPVRGRKGGDSSNENSKYQDLETFGNFSANITNNIQDFNILPPQQSEIYKVIKSAIVLYASLYQCQYSTRHCDLHYFYTPPCYQTL